MWYGDSVTLKDWPDIWLNEGFATWSNWIWSEMQGNKSAHSPVQGLLQTASPAGSGTRRPGDPGAEHLFDWGAVYVRGAMTLQALREKVGDDVFFDIMRDLGAGTPLRCGHDGAVRPALRGEERHGTGRLLPGVAVRVGQAARVVS